MYTGKLKRLIGKTQADADNYLVSQSGWEAKSREKTKETETPEESRAKKDHKNMLARMRRAEIEGRSFDPTEDARKQAALKDPNRENKYGSIYVPQSQWSQKHRDQLKKDRQRRDAEKKSQQ